jgi:hypothetical protein
MPGRIIKRERLIVVREGLQEIARDCRGNDHEAVSDHQRHGHVPPLRQGKEFRRKLEMRVNANG